MVRRIQIGLAVAVLAVLLLLNVRVHRAAGTDATVRHLRWLESALEDGAAGRMQDWFPEGYVFTWALYALASAQTAELLADDHPRRAHLLAEAGSAVDSVLSERAGATFPSRMSPPRGAFYNSWALYATAVYVRAAGPDGVPERRLRSFREMGDRFAEALAAAETPFLPSYPGSAWPADTSVGVAALAIWDRTVEPRYGATVRTWVADARARLHRELGALSHSADAETGEPFEVRGSSLALMSRVLVDADPTFAREQYEILRRRFGRTRLGLPGIAEFADGRFWGGDIDSGPLILGFSGPAVVVGAAAARAHGDERLAGALLRLTELGGFPVGLTSRRYLGGAVPVGDAFIAWARSTPPAPDTPAHPTAFPPWWWPLTVHLLSLAVAWRAVAVLRAHPVARP